MHSDILCPQEIPVVVVVIMAELVKPFLDASALKATLEQDVVSLNLTRTEEALNLFIVNYCCGKI